LYIFIFRYLLKQQNNNTYHFQLPFFNLGRKLDNLKKIILQTFIITTCIIHVVIINN
jgi:hypothetical protein